MAHGLGREKGLTVLEAVVSLCVIGALVLVVVPRYQRVTREARESALKAELTNLRFTIRLFRQLNGRYPASLREMMEKKILQPARTGADGYGGSVFDDRYLLPNAVDGEGNVIDVFGNPYRYDADRGSVRPTTAGYESW